MALGNSNDALGDTSRSIVEQLLAAGADINASIMHSGEKRHSKLLRRICFRSNTSESLGVSAVVLGYARNPMETRNLLRFLVSKGAGPNMVFMGRTAFDILLNGLDRMIKESQEYLLSLATILRAEDKNTVMVFRPGLG